MYCKYCRAEINNETKYCTKCGREISSPHVEILEVHPVKNQKGNKGLVTVMIILLVCIVGVWVTFFSLYKKRSEVERAYLTDDMLHSSSEIKTNESNDQDGVDINISSKMDIEGTKIDTENEIVPTETEIKIIDEAEKYLCENAPLSAAEVLTKAISEDYYPAIYKKLVEIRDQTKDYEEHEVHFSFHGASFTEYITERQYVGDKLCSETMYYLMDGEKFVVSTNTYNVDSDDNYKYVHTDLNVNSGDTTNYVRENTKDGNKTISTEYIDQVGGRINRIDTYENGNNLRTQIFDENGEVSFDCITEYDDHGNILKKTKTDNGLTETELYMYEDGGYGRVIRKEVESEVKNSITIYEYNKIGFTTHNVTKEKKHNAMDQGYQSKTDCEYDALGREVRLESRTVYDDGSETGNIIKYTHDYHYLVEDKIESDEDNYENYISLYNDMIKKIVSGQELISDEGEVYEYSIAADPGYALYDIDGDGMEELFVTGDTDNEWHTYTVYYIKDGNLEPGEVINGNVPDKGWWIYGFEYVTNVYSFSKEDGFSKVAKIDYPVDDEDIPIMITYEGKEPEGISFEELDALLYGETVDPQGIKWMKLNENTRL